MNPHHPEVSARAGERCEYCRAPEQAFNFAFEAEHVVPSIKGGDDDETNWALACRAYNVHKGAVVEAADPHSGQIVRLFHPRTDRWAEHFGNEPASGDFDLPQRTAGGSGQGEARRQGVRSPVMGLVGSGGQTETEGKAVGALHVERVGNHGGCAGNGLHATQGDRTAGHPAE